MVVSKVYWNNDASNYFITVNGAGKMYHTSYYGIFFRTGGSDRLAIDSTGYVGIGTSSPVYNLDVNGVAKATSLYADSYVWLAPNSDAIYLNNTSIAWHNSSNAWTDTLILFARNSITLNKNTTVQGNILATGGITTNDSITINGIKLSKSKDGVLYLDGNLVVKGGVTMYGTDATTSPSIIDSLPIASTSSKGIAQFNPSDFAVKDGVVSFVGSVDGGVASSVAWSNITGKPSWIGSSKPTYTYSEIQNTPDLSLYAKKTDIPSLSGYATESWVKQQNYAIKATTLSGYGITDAYTKTNVDDLLKAYVTLSGEQTISGKKNFTTGGLFVNGSQIKYDATKKYWKLEGDLLVTGGVTMYGSDSSFTPSTIMDAIAVDGTTISKDGGVLKVIGGTGGGVADSVAWANITGKPTWIGSTKPSYSYSEITGAISTTELQNYLTQNSYLNVTEGDNRYLKLSGGKMNASACISWDSAEGGEDYSAYNLGIKLLGYNANTNNYRGGIHVGTRYGWQLVRNGYYDTLEFRTRKDSTNTFDVWKTIAFTDSNVASATKLQTARTIWGNSFDGTSDVYGAISNTYGILPSKDSTYDIGSASNQYRHVYASWFGAKKGEGLSFGANNSTHLAILSSGNVGIGTSIPYYKLDVNGVAKATSLYAASYVWLAPNSDAIYLNNTSIAWHNSSNAWTDTLILFARNSITLNKSTTVNGDILSTGGITMYSMRALKNVVDERGLSLSELSTIKPTRYTWKDGRDNRLHFGGIADDIQQVLPEVVYSTSDGILTMDYGNAAFAVASSLIQPVVDHEKRIAMLEEENKQLRQEVERLKSA